MHMRAILIQLRDLADSKTAHVGCNAGVIGQSLTWLTLTSSLFSLTNPALPAHMLAILTTH
jgi:hypothetical protein